NMNIKFVQTIVPQAEVVGQESIMLPVKAGDWTNTDVDMSACLEALGLTEASEVLSLNSLSVITEDGTMSEPMSPSTGAAISDAGYLDLSETLENTHINVEFDVTDSKTLQFAIEEYLSDWADDTRITSKIGFQKETSIYIFNVSFVSESVYTGITSAKAAKSSTLFDLSGRRVSKAERGIYIRDGKKVVK
nr:hypothetical protein [Bacteroidaceae bacterium]